MAIVTEFVKNLLANVWLESGSCYYHHMYTSCDDHEEVLPHPTLDYWNILSDRA